MLTALIVLTVGTLCLWWPSDPDSSVASAPVRQGNDTFEELVKRASRLPYKVPTTHNTLSAVANGDPARQHAIERFAAQTHPFMHVRATRLAEEFLKFKRTLGTDKEMSFYGKAKMDVGQFITRLLQHRPLVFMDADDQYVLVTGQRGEGSDNFVNIGTDAEKEPLTLASYISYDEMQVSALLGVAVPSFFINDGSRQNGGKPGAPGTFEGEGLVIDQVGCRFERPGLMEWQHMVVSKQQNIPQRGYGPVAGRNASLLDVWAAFYGLDHFPTYLEAKEASSLPGQGHLWFKIDAGFLNVHVFLERYRIIAQTFLSECSGWGLKQNTPGSTSSRTGSYCTVQESIEREPWWTIDSHQSLWLLQSFKDVLTTLRFPGVRVVDFARFNDVFFKQVFGQDGILNSTHGSVVEVRHSSREPGARLSGKYKGLRTVYTFAGDSNGYPGNEYWLGELGSSADPAAAASSLIPWLQNPSINPSGLSGGRTQFWGGSEAAQHAKAGHTPWSDTGLLQILLTE